MRCCVPICANSDTRGLADDCEIGYVTFPSNPGLRRAWLQAFRMWEYEVSNCTRVCTEHFRDDALYKTKKGEYKVKTGALPAAVQEDELDAPADLKVCRLCLGTGRTMYQLRGSQLEVAYQHVTGMLVCDGDKLPQKICWECAHRLRACFKFKAKSLLAHRQLIQLLFNHGQITVGLVKTVDMNQYPLKSNLKYKYFEPNDCQLHITEYQVVSETEEKDQTSATRIINGNDEIDHDDGNDEVTSNTEDAVTAEETKNELYYECEYLHDTDDDQRSEVMTTETAMNKTSDMSKEDAADLSAEAADRYSTDERNSSDRSTSESMFTITFLTVDEQLAEVQKRRESAKYKEARYKCTVCYRGCKSKQTYDLHMLRHSEKCGTFECMICRTRYKTKSDLGQHFKSHHTEKFSCNRCPFVTMHRWVALKHTKWHEGATYQCPHCPRVFANISTYMSHMRIKHVSDFVCELCGYTFLNKRGIAMHKAKMHIFDTSLPLKGPYCEVCDIQFVSDVVYTRHLKLSSRHCSEDDPNRIRNLSQDMNEVDEKKVYGVRKLNMKPVSCAQCGVQLRNPMQYSHHLRKFHPDQFPIKKHVMCEQCGKRFQHMAQLRNHTTVHTGEKSFKCNKCDKSFSQKVHLMSHMPVHSGTRRTYDCPLCGKQFLYYSNRERHLQNHSGVKRFKCETCDKGFTTFHSQRMHMHHVHNKQPWPKRVRLRARGARHTSE